MRVTPSGFQKLAEIIPPLVNSAFGPGYCVPQQEFGFYDPIFNTFTGLAACRTNTAPGCNPGCDIDISAPAQGITVAPLNGYNNRLRVNLAMNLTAKAGIGAYIADAEVLGCTITVNSSNFGGSFDIDLDIRPDNGELDLNVANVNNIQLNLDFGGCGFASQFLDELASLVQAIANLAAPLLSGVADDLVDQLLPSPLGIANMMDIGTLMAGISPGTDGFMEARIVPGGYATTGGGGLNLGVITALNADEDPTTRSAALVSEPHLCVPPLPGPDFANLGLGSVFRSAFGGNTFTLNAAGQFSGQPDPTIPGKTVDLALGISETTLDLAGHHLVTSGGMCLGVGTNLIAQLNVGTIGLLVPSLGELASDEGNDPLLLVTRPQRAIDFTVGDNTTASPALTLHLEHMEVDFYAFIWERYTRAFTLDLTMDVGINMTFEQQGNTTVIKPELVGLSASEVTVKVLNSQFVRESAAQLESTLPSVFNLVTSLGALPDIPVPAFGSLSVNPLQITKVTTSQDTFLALYAGLGASPMMRLAANNDLDTALIVQKMDEGTQQGPQSQGRARLLEVDTPSAEIIRDQLISQTGALPTITFDVDRFDAQGRELEWTWNINGGIWHPYTSPVGGALVLTDKAFAWQGRYEIGLKSRVKGAFRTTSEIIRQKVTIDSVGPKMFADKVEWDGDQLKIKGWDIVGGRDFEVAYGEVGGEGPGTKWVNYREASLARATAMKLANASSEIAVYARDELGNQTVTVIAFHGQAGSSGCNCETSGKPGAGSLILMGLVGLGLLRPRRRQLAKRIVGRLVRVAKSRAIRTAVMFVGVVLVSSLVPACSCGKNEGQSCETAADCGPDFCEEGQLPFCIDNTCVCSDDIPPGRIGPYSDVGFGGGAIWVSAYASSHGDLVVASASGGRIPNESWEWVDGIPDGPVLVPDSKIRYGIEDAGDDIGMYTSIQVGSDALPRVSYFDRTSASLKYASRGADGTWTTHIVQQGTSQIDPGSGGGSLVGMYTSLTLRSDDGRPGIAYLAHVADAQGQRAEVRYASAQTPNPTSSSDWTFWTVDTAPIPENPDEIYPLPGGLGLFVDSARNPMNQAPVVVYYDRTNGDLKLARFNPQSGQFATPVIVDGSGGIDAGWSPSVAVDTAGVAHMVYVSATGDDLTYKTDAQGAVKETIDNGYRIVGTTVDGLPKPEFHFVGDDANLILVPGGAPTVIYQDATTQEMLIAQKGTNGMWVRTSVAGATDPWPGAYGFFASGVLSTTEIIMSSWVIDQPNSDNWVEVIGRPFAIQ